MRSPEEWHCAQATDVWMRSSLTVARGAGNARFLIFAAGLGRRNPRRRRVGIFECLRIVADVAPPAVLLEVARIKRPQIGSGGGMRGRRGGHVSCDSVDRRDAGLG